MKKLKSSVIGSFVVPVRQTLTLTSLKFYYHLSTQLVCAHTHTLTYHTYKHTHICHQDSHIHRYIFKTCETLSLRQKVS